MWPQCFLSKRFPWGAASKLWPHICNCDNGYDILFGRCHQNYFLMAASIPCLLFSILVSPSLAEKILQFQQLVELLRIVLLSLTLEHSRMDCQLLWQHLSKLGLALPSWQLTEPRTKKMANEHTVYGHSLENLSEVVTALVYMHRTICVSFCCTRFRENRYNSHPTHCWLWLHRLSLNG